MQPSRDPPDRPIILFDGVCNLCTGAVRFVLRREAQPLVRFCSLQSDTGQRLLAEHGLPEHDGESFVVIDGGQVFLRSDAALHICAGLRRPWRWLRGMRVVPRPLRDAGYRLVARNRYRWFGRAETCLVPGSELEQRFIE